MATGLQRIHAAMLVIPITIMAIIIIGLSGSAFEDTFSDTKIIIINAVSPTLMSYAVPAATCALAAAVAGAWFAVGKADGWVQAASAFSTALIAWAFGLVIFGFACKHAAVGGSVEGKLKGLSGVCIILFLLETVYVAFLHLLIAPLTTSSTT